MNQHRNISIRPRIAKATPTSRMGGWMEWELVSRAGVVVAGGEQHNLILNQGLDAFASRGLNSQTSSTFFNGAAVGTGNAEPGPTQTDLANEVHRTNNKAPSGGTTVARVADGVYELVTVWEFGFDDANDNLTEWGVVAGNLFCRELFRNAQGDPVVITKTSDYLLRIKYTFTITLTPAVAVPHSMTIDGIGVVAGTFSAHAGYGSVFLEGFDLHAFSHVARGVVSSTYNSGYVAASDLPVPTYINLVNHKKDHTVDTSGAQSWSSYNPGDYSRSTSVVIPTGKSNTLIASVSVLGGFIGGSSRYSGFAFNIDPGDRFTKDSNHILTITDVLTVTWGRD